MADDEESWAVFLATATSRMEKLRSGRRMLGGHNVCPKQPKARARISAGSGSLLAATGGQVLRGLDNNVYSSLRLHFVHVQQRVV